MIRYSKEISEANLYYYTFSTIVQGFLGLVALLGTVVIFKIQLLENEMKTTTETSFSHIQDNFEPNIAIFSALEMMNKLGEICDKQQTSGLTKAVYLNLTELNSAIGDIRTKMVDFTLFSFLNISLALIGLPLSKIIIENANDYWAIIYLVINISLSLYSLLLAFKIVRSSLGYSFRL